MQEGVAKAGCALYIFQPITIPKNIILGIVSKERKLKGC